MTQAKRNQQSPERFSRELARFVGRKRPWSTDELAAEVGVSVSTIRAYLRGDIAPEYSTLIAIARALPANFTSALLADAGLTGAYPVETPERACPFDMLSELSDRTNLLAHHLRDGHFDHREVLVQLAAFRDLSARLDQYIAALEAGRVSPRKQLGG